MRSISGRCETRSFINATKAIPLTLSNLLKGHESANAQPFLSALHPSAMIDKPKAYPANGSALVPLIMTASSESQYTLR